MINNYGDKDMDPCDFFLYLDPESVGAKICPYWWIP